VGDADEIEKLFEFFTVTSGVSSGRNPTFFWVAGPMILLGVALAWLHSTYWLVLAAFVGANLLQSSLSGFCPAATIFKKNRCALGKCVLA
jgi:hypothetical protein